MSGLRCITDSAAAESDNSSVRAAFLSRFGSLGKLFAGRGHVAATAAFVGDQAICSGGNFIMSFVAARHLPTAEFGVFALLNLVAVFSLTVNNWLIRSSLSSISQTSDAGVARRYTSSLTSIAALFALFPAAVLCAAAVLLRHAALCLPLLLCAVAAQVQETLRRAAMAQSKYRIGVTGDAISYLGQAAILILFAAFHLLTLSRIFWIIGLTSVASFGVQLRSLMLGRPSQLLSTARTCWSQGRWITLSGIILSPVVYGMPWLLEITHGQTEAGMLAGLLLVLGVSNPIMFSCTWLILVRGQVARHGHIYELLRRVVPPTLIVSVPLFLYWVGLFLFPHQALVLFLGAHRIYTTLVGSLRLVIIYYLVAYAAVCLEVMTDAREKSRNRVGIDAAASGIMLVAGVFAAKQAGLPGVVVAGTCVQAIRIVAYAFLLTRPLASPPMLPGQTVEQE